jgi:glycerate 2-kinase
VTPEALLRDAFAAGIEAVHPARTLPPHLPPRSWSGRTFLFALGKGAASMAAEAVARLDIHAGLVIAPHGTALDSLRCHPGLSLLTAAHPVPDAASLAAGRAAVALAQDTRPGDRLIALISGGGSSLMVSPALGIDLAEKEAINAVLLASGAPIKAMNIIRSGLSRVKGGGLLRHVHPDCRVHTIIMSDVPGDAPHLVASGPTLAWENSGNTPLELCHRYAIPLSASALRALGSGEPLPRRRSDTVAICATGDTMLEAVSAHLRRHGIHVVNLGSRIEEDAVTLAQQHAHHLVTSSMSPPWAIVSGGETSVRLGPSPGRGGRNLTYALALAIALGDRSDTYGLAADTDGVDGNSGFAGALVTPRTLSFNHDLGRKPEDLLADQCSALAFSDEAKLHPGATGVNVNDIRIALRTNVLR